MSAVKLVIINLKKNLNNLTYPFLLSLGPDDIALLNSIDNLLKKYFGRPWAYVGSEKPYKPKPELLSEIDNIDASDDQKKRLKKLVTEIEFPSEIEVVLSGGDKKGEFHNHIFSILSSLQMEQYIVPENEILIFEILHDDAVHKLEIKGPSVLFAGTANHRREKGECFVVKFPSGNFKKIFEKTEP